MRKINKGQEPQILADNKEQWRKELVLAALRGDSNVKYLKNKYNQPSIKEALRCETFAKCMYCESDIGHIAFEHIEHIKPKAMDLDLTFEWENLGIACQKCNHNKGDKYDEDLKFLNPYEDEPSDYLLAVGHLLYHRPGNRRGELTLKELKLNRSELIEKRKERIDSMQTLLDKYSNEDNPRLKELLKGEIITEFNPEKEYSFFVKAFVKIAANIAA